MFGGAVRRHVKKRFGQRQNQFGVVWCFGAIRVGLVFMVIGLRPKHPVWYGLAHAGVKACTQGLVQISQRLCGSGLQVVTVGQQCRQGSRQGVPCACEE